MKNTNQKKTLIIVILFFLSIISVNAQLDTRTQNQIKAKFLTAQEYYDVGNYSESLEKVGEIEALTNGQLLAAAQNLKVKCLVGQGQYVKAKDELYTLEGLNLSSDILKDIAVYAPVIEKNIEAVKKEEELEKFRKLYAQKEKEREEIEKNEEKLKLDQLIESTLLALEESNYDWSKNHDLAIITDSYDFGLINKNGEVKIPIEHSKIVINEKIAYVQDYEGYKLINTKTGSLNATEYEELFLFGNSILVLETENYVKIINCNLNDQVIFESKKRSGNEDGITGVDIDSNFEVLYIEGHSYENSYTNFAVLDKNGRFLVDLNRYDSISDFEEDGFAEVERNELSGLIDLSGNEIVSPKYAIIYDFKGENLAMIKTFSNKYGYINKKGIEVIPAIYYSASFFENGTAIVRDSYKSKSKRINEKGEKVK